MSKTRQAAKKKEMGKAEVTNAVEKLTLLFLAWKLVLLAVVVLTPDTLGGGSGYDTSGDLWWLISSDKSIDGWSWRRVLVKLTRWDAVYFANIAKNGYVLEQEWAFGWGWTKLISLVGNQACKLLKCSDSAEMLLGVGVILANMCHFLSVLVLHQLAKTALGPSLRSGRVAFLAAALHVLSPAGVFLLAPYSEALFSLLGFMGLWIYAAGLQSSNEFLQIATTLTTAVFFAASATVRGNGLLFAAMLAYDVALIVVQVLQPFMSDQALLLVSAFGIGRTATLWKQKDLLLTTLQTLSQDLDVAAAVESLGPYTTFAVVTSLVSIAFSTASLLDRIPFIRADAQQARFFIGVPAILAGLVTVAGFAYPQFLAYQEYCTGASQPPWCIEFPPSIYTSIQSRYWNVGLFRYWTVSNLPLFLLATPMLVLLFWSSIQVLIKPSGTAESIAIQRRLALPQVLLAVLATTTFHVQIVNRLASGYPLWYLFLAEKVDSLAMDAKRDEKKAESSTKWSQWAVRGMVCYALMQAVLFAAFLPPA